jgi:hypothetical protein
LREFFDRLSFDNGSIATSISSNSQCAVDHSVVITKFATNSSSTNSSSGNILTASFVTVLANAIAVVRGRKVAEWRRLLSVPSVAHLVVVASPPPLPILRQIRLLRTLER